MPQEKKGHKRHKMKKLIELLKVYLKKVFSDLHNVIVGIVVVAIVSGGSIYLFFRNLWTQLQNIAQSPTPLWGTIVLVLLLLGYIKVNSIRPFKIPKLFKACGVYWDADYNMYCLSCMKPLKNSSDINSSLFYCCDPKCNSKYILKNDTGNELTIQDAIHHIENKKCRITS